MAMIYFVIDYTCPSKDEPHLPFFSPDPDFGMEVVRAKQQKREEIILKKLLEAKVKKVIKDKRASRAKVRHIVDVMYVKMLDSIKELRLHDMSMDGDDCSHINYGQSSNKMEEVRGPNVVRDEEEGEGNHGDEAANFDVVHDLAVRIVDEAFNGFGFGSGLVHLLSKGNVTERRRSHYQSYRRNSTSLQKGYDNGNGNRNQNADKAKAETTSSFRSDVNIDQSIYDIESSSNRSDYYHEFNSSHHESENENENQDDNDTSKGNNMNTGVSVISLLRRIGQIIILASPKKVVKGYKVKPTETQPQEVCSWGSSESDDSDSDSDFDSSSRSSSEYERHEEEQRKLKQDKGENNNNIKRSLSSGSGSFSRSFNFGLISGSGSVSAFDKSKHESDGEVIALTPEDEDLIKLEAAAQVVNENQKRTSFTMPNEQISPLELKSKNIEFRPWWEQ